MGAVAGASQVHTADEALARLIAGNERFVRGEARFPTVQKEILAELARGQHPYATILGCSDSRVPPELVFDAGFGELFIVRVEREATEERAAKHPGAHVPTVSRGALSGCPRQRAAGL